MGATQEVSVEIPRARVMSLVLDASLAMEGLLQQSLLMETLYKSLCGVEMSGDKLPATRAKTCQGLRSLRLPLLRSHLFGSPHLSSSLSSSSPSLFLSSFILCICMFRLHVCMLVVSTEARRGGSSRTELIGGCEVPYECWELNSRPLQGYPVLLTLPLPSLPLPSSTLLFFDLGFP